MKGFAARLWQQQEGQAVTEYALLLVLISLMAVSAIKTVATSLDKVYSDVSVDLVVYYTSIQTKNFHRHHSSRIKRSSEQVHDGKPAKIITKGR